MPKNNVSSLGKFETYFKLPNRDLRTYFGKVVKGQPEIYDTPFARGESTEDMLEKWNAELVSINDKWPSLYEYEVDLAAKVGPMSVMKPLKQRMKDIESYYEGILLPSQPIDERAVRAVVSEFSPMRGLEIRDQKRTIELMKKSSNSGSPYFTKRRAVVEDTFPCDVYTSGRDVTQWLHDNVWSAAAVLGWRGQEGGPSAKDVKQRVVWMFPFAVNIRELQVYQPLIEAAQRFDLVSSWVSMDAVDRKVTKLFDTKSSDDLIVCTDFEKFDQHFNSSLQNAASTILQAIFTPTRSALDWFEEVFPIKYMIPLAYDYGKVKYGQHGMGSGSGGTNADETLAHRALQYEAAQRANTTLNPNSQCLGDDGILSYPGITVEDVVRTYTSHGLKMNEIKQHARTQDCTYLRRWYHSNYRINGICRGVYSTNRALGRLRYLEHYYEPDVWSSKMVALRQLSIIENVKWHPLREQFVQFCMKRDKYRLGIDIPGFLDNIDAEAAKAISLIPDFLGYTKTLQAERKGDMNIGMSNWWVVQYLKSM